MWQSFLTKTKSQAKETIVLAKTESPQKAQQQLNPFYFFIL